MSFVRIIIIECFKVLLVGWGLVKTDYLLSRVVFAKFVVISDHRLFQDALLFKHAFSAVAPFKPNFLLLSLLAAGGKKHTYFL